MKICYCDICQSLIKQGDKKFILAINSAYEVGKGEEEPLITNLQDLVKQYKRGVDDTRIYEICEECKKILEHLFTMRKKERKTILKELENMYKEKSSGEVD